MRTLFFVWLITTAGRLIAGETPEVPVAVYTESGSRLHGMLQPRPVVLRKAEGGTLNLDWSTVKSISFGERLDPNLENDALIAINDLGSDKFEVRSAAQTKLRSLGHAAYRALKTAAASGDAETAARAKAMMAELAGRNAADRSQDEIVFTDGKTARGELSSTEALVRTRYGMLAFAAQAVVKIESVPKTAVNIDALVAVNAPPQNVGVAAANEKPPEAERWDPVQEAALGEGIRVAEIENLRAVTMELRPKPGAPRQAVPVERGTRLDDAYADWGAVMHSSDAAANVVATDAPDDQVFGGSSRMALKTMAADLEIDFIKPGSFDPNTGAGRSGGVRLVGAIVRAKGAQTIGLAVYDRGGRQIAQVFNRNDSNMAAGGVRQDEFLGVKSPVPIARARFFRADVTKTQDVLLDDLVFDRVLDGERNARHCTVALVSGERLSGVLTSALPDDEDGIADSLRLRPAFLDDKSAPIEIPLKEVDRYEPAQTVAVDDKGEKRERPWSGTPHGVLLQNGEFFRARLLMLDDKEIQFGLPGGVELKLPRAVVRKIELQLPSVAPGGVPPPVTVAADEKPGVDFRKRQGAENEEKKAEPEVKPDPARNPAQGLPRMDDVDIVAADPTKGELTVRDDNGDFDIGFQMAKTLVFKPDPNAAKPNPKFRDWTLQLNESSRFDIFVKAISADAIRCEMAGGRVTMPSHVIDFIQRQKR